MNNTKGNETILDDDSDLTPEELEYAAMIVKPKEVVIILFILILWLFSVHR